MKWLISIISAMFIVIFVAIILMKVLSVTPEEYLEMPIANEPTISKDSKEPNRAFLITYDVFINNRDQFIINDKLYNRKEADIFFINRVGKLDDESKLIKYNGNKIIRVVAFKGEHTKIVVNINPNSKALYSLDCMFLQCVS
jgi:hypothetical protein